jgi:hypothetical protein
MLLNKIPILDSGYVALIDSHMTTQKLRDVGQEFFGGECPVALEEFGTMTVAIKCPLFVQLYLSKFMFRIINGDNNVTTVAAYRPNVGELGCPERLDAEAIADDISRTTDALLINPKAYQKDGCDKFISQIISPINVYTHLIVQGSYSEWRKFTCTDDSGRIPQPIRVYLLGIKQILETEWKFNG